MKSFANRQKPVWRNANPVPQSGHTFIDQRPESRAQRQMIETIRQSPLATPGIVPQQQPVMPQAVVQQKSGAPVQMVKENAFNADPQSFMAENLILFNYGSGFRQRYPNTCNVLGDRIAENNFNAAIKAVMIANKNALNFSLKKQDYTTLDGKSIFFVAPELGKLDEEALTALFSNDNKALDDVKELIAMLQGEEDGSVEALIKAQYVPYFNGKPERHKPKEVDDNVELLPEQNDEQIAEDDLWSDVGSNVIDAETTRFVFTDPMNGCAYAITGVENKKTQFVAWHFQSETDNWREASTFRAVKEIRDWYGVNDYYPGPVQNNLAATNILWQDQEDGWKMLSQRNIVPLGLNGVPKMNEFDAKDINVDEKMSKENLALLHEKLNAKAVALVSDTKVNRINQIFSQLSITSDGMDASLQKVAPANNALNAAATGEFDRVAKVFPKLLKNADDKYEIFKELSQLSEGYINIPKDKASFMKSATYNKAEVLKFKTTFAAMSRKLKNEVSDMLLLCQQNPVTTSLANDNSQQLQRIKQVRAYYDLYDSGAYAKAHNLTNELAALVSAKRNALEKKSTLENEMNLIYPPEEVVEE